MRKSLIPAITLVFATACSPVTEYQYSRSDNLKNITSDDEEIRLRMYENDIDWFILSTGQSFLSNESTVIRYEGEFNKDSVDKAVDRYYRNGTLPKKIDLY